MAHDHEEVLAALHRKRALEGNCPACGIADAWRVSFWAGYLPVPDDPEATDAGTELHAIDEQGNFALKGFLAHPVMCGHCGFIRLFHLETLMAE